MIDRKTTEVWDILEEVTKGHPVMLNRAPTLHRLSIQAFEPVLIEGAAIRVHPLVCTAYNADFDGDQMAVHVPLSVEAQMEARQLMLAPNNIFSPSSGTPDHDAVAGHHPGLLLPDLGAAAHGEGPRRRTAHLPLFENTDGGRVRDRRRRKVRLPRLDPPAQPGLRTGHGLRGARKRKIHRSTTPGRVRFNEIWPEGLGFINKTVGKKQIGDIIWRCYQVAGQAETVETLDELKGLGFREATRSGISIGIVDMVIPEEKGPDDRRRLRRGREGRRSSTATVSSPTASATRRSSTSGPRATDNDRQRALPQARVQRRASAGAANPLFMMVDSGARGNKSQIKQLSGMRGLMAKPSGEIIERPITSNFREGLSVLEYFISTHGARKGLADTALKTADSGYMTRKLVDVAQDVIVTEQDCGTVNGITVQPDLRGRRGGRIAGDPDLRPGLLRGGQRPGDRRGDRRRSTS